MNRAWHMILTAALCAPAACSLKSPTSAPTAPAEVPHLALSAAHQAPTTTPGSVQTAEAQAPATAPVPTPTAELMRPEEKNAVAREDLPLPRLPAQGMLPRLPAGDPRRGKGSASLQEEPADKAEATTDKGDEGEKGPIVQTKIVGGEQRLRFENGGAITQLVKGGALQLIAFVSVAGTGRHYAYSESAGLLPMPEAAYTALVEQGRVLEMPADPTVRSELKVGDSSQYTIAVGDVIEHRLATALADSSGGATRSIAVVDETGNVRVALARR